MSRSLSLILVSSKRSQYSLKTSWLQFRDRTPQDVPKLSYCQKTKMISGKKEVNQLKKRHLMAKLWQHGCQCENNNYGSLEPTETKRHPKYKMIKTIYITIECFRETHLPMWLQFHNWGGGGAGGVKKKKVKHFDLCNSFLSVNNSNSYWINK